MDSVILSIQNIISKQTREAEGHILFLLFVKEIRNFPVLEKSV